MSKQQSSRISVRIKPELKEQVEEIFDDLGMTISEAVILFLNQVRLYDGIPLSLRRGYSHVPKADTLAYIERVERGEEELIGPFDSTEDLWRSLGI